MRLHERGILQNQCQRYTHIYIHVHLSKSHNRFQLGLPGYIWQNIYIFYNTYKFIADMVLVLLLLLLLWSMLSLSRWPNGYMARVFDIHIFIFNIVTYGLVLRMIVSVQCTYIWLYQIDVYYGERGLKCIRKPILCTSSEERL